jgi:hypothetical protein
MAKPRATTIQQRPRPQMYPSLKMRQSLAADYAKKYGCKAIHRIWRDEMIQQKREVIKERMSWDTLPDNDKALDSKIAYEIIMDWFTYMYGEPTKS